MVQGLSEDVVLHVCCRVGHSFERRRRGWSSPEPRPAGPQAALLAAAHASGAALQPPGARRLPCDSGLPMGALAGAKPVCRLPCPATMLPRPLGMTFATKALARSVTRIHQCDMFPQQMLD
jgi:hypothetical protein